MGCLAPFPAYLRLTPPHMTKRGRPPYRSRSASGTPPFTRPCSLPLRPAIYVETVLGAYNGTETVLISTGSVVPVFSASSSPLSRLSLVLYCPVPDNSDIHNGSSI